jgi:hypothetical protein
VALIFGYAQFIFQKKYPHWVLGLDIIASKQLPLLEAIIFFPKLRKVSFGKRIIA